MNVKTKIIIGIGFGLMCVIVCLFLEALVSMYKPAPAPNENTG